MKIVLAQLNPVIGDLAGNLDRIEQLLATAGATADLLVLPELYLTGYPPYGLLEKRWFRGQVEAALARLEAISARYPETGILVGAPTPAPGDSSPTWYNSALFLAGGKRMATQNKGFLPPYDLFNEAVYFQPGSSASVVNFKGKRLGIIIGEDLWARASASQEELVPSPFLTGIADRCDLVVTLAAYPFIDGWTDQLYRFGAASARRFRRPFLLVNQVGANEELIFSGESFLFNPEGAPLFVAPAFQEAVAVVDPEGSPSPHITPRPPARQAIYKALILGIRDYARKNGFTKAVLGLSGGIDSAVVCCLAAAALGPENVLAVTMPSPYSSVGSVEDSRQLAATLGVGFMEIPITPYFQAYLEGLAPFIGPARNPGDTTEENIQARIRANILMALSNRYGYLVLGAGNKSELMVGYCTLNGVDMTGGLGVLSDVPKTMVYELAAEINQGREVIPAAIITKPPSAELRPDQTDQDTLPPYPILDRVLKLYLDENRTPEEITAQGFNRETVAWIIKAVHRTEYKRRQVVPGLRVTTNPLGPRYRLPVGGKIQI
ncbi:MAG: NAD+ synthase [Firmicutes bacterium]|nr:NAD+ synthase [Bacillota bacterium]